jgi:hypothetical protein
MVDERLTEGSIYDINVVYNSKLEGYMTSMSHMNELYAIEFIEYQKAIYVNKLYYILIIIFRRDRRNGI